MTLAFKQTFPSDLKLIGNNKTYFVEKIISGLHSLESFRGFSVSVVKYMDLDFMESVLPEFNKLHTIRADHSHRWKVGMKIHFVINNRQPTRVQFAQVLNVIRLQEVWISERKVMVWSSVRNVVPEPTVIDTLDGYWKTLAESEVDKLARHDGFNNTDEFFAYFNSTFFGKIIHWTDLQY